MHRQPEDFSSLYELLEYFKDEHICTSYLVEQRWQGHVICHHCNHNKVYELKGENKRFKCAACRKQFTAKAGTIFEDSKLPLRKWFAAIYLVLSHRKGISSYQLARDLKISQKTAWFLGMRIRNAIKQGTFDKQLTGVVEVDETFIGGKNKNRHADKKLRLNTGRSHKDKTPVLGIIQRGGELRAFVIPNTSQQIIQPIIEEQVAYHSTIYTDEWNAYRYLWVFYDHAIVEHSVRQYVNGEAHTNTLEGFWSQLKRSIIGIYVKVSPGYLQRYVDEAVYRYNSRKLSDGHKALNLLSKSGGSIKYKQLVYEGKKGKQKTY
jgi:transposase-like protein